MVRIVLDDLDEESVTDELLALDSKNELKMLALNVLDNVL